MSKIRRWAWNLLVVLAIVPLASCGVMKVPAPQEPDPITQIIASKATSPGASEQPPSLPSIPDVAPTTGDAQPVTSVQVQNEPRDDNLVNELAEHFKQPKELVQRIVATATRLARDEFPRRNDILAIIAVESSFNPRASHKGSKGLMQIQLSSHRDALKGKRPYDVDDNLTLGSAILEEYYLELNRSRRAAVLAYNAGIGNFLKKHFVSRYYTKYLATLKFIDSIPE